jgi:hypothetical protein
MTRTIHALGALLGALVSVPAQAQGVPDGYACSARAFSGTAGIHAVGVGEVTLRTDAAYRPAGGTFTYQVSDRVSGAGRMTVTWALPDGGRGELGELRSLFLPLGRSFPVAPASLALSLDESSTLPPVTIKLTPEHLQILADGSFNGVRLSKPAVTTPPDPAGSRSLRYSVKSQDGSELAADMFLLPDWNELRPAIRSAVREAESLLRKRDCDPFYVVGGQR